MKPKTKVIKHKKNFNHKFGFNIDYPKPKVKNQVSNHDKSPNKTSIIGQINKQQNMPKSNKIQFPLINPEPNKLPNVKNEKDNPLYKPKGKEKPKTEIKNNNNKMDIEDKFDKNKIIRKPITTIINNRMNIGGEDDNNIGKPITNVKNNKMKMVNLPDKKAGQASTTIKNNKMNVVDEKNKNSMKPKTEVNSNKININTTHKIPENKNQNNEKKESEINKYYINSINNVRLPEELYDISYDLYKEK